jgi:hypothetical protein
MAKRTAAGEELGRPKSKSLSDRSARLSILKKMIGIGPFFYYLIRTWVPLKNAVRLKLTNINGARSCA